MKIKKFLARSMPEAMQQIRKELGADAVILQSKEVKKGGFLGLFKNKRMEVVAALDPSPQPQDVPEKKQSRPAQPTVIPKSRNSENDQQVLKEIQYVKELLEQQAFTSDRHFSPLYELTHQYLLQQELNEQLALELLHEVEKRDDSNEITTKQEMKQALEAVLTTKLPHDTFQGFSQAKQIIQFVGPTGVGKTTTLAKVAAKAILQDKKKIAFITMDTYRIAAIDQLKTYARILDVPVEVAYSLDDYKQALQKLKPYDLIFVDTAGRNFRHPQYVHELERTLEVERNHVETVLVLSLTAKAQDTIDIYKQFEPLKIEKVIFTKLDETLTYGSIFNIGISENKQIIYVTNGQNVPENLLEPSASKMTQLLLSRYEND